MNFVMWYIETVFVGSLGFIFYKLVNYISKNCYLYKVRAYHPRYDIASNFRQCVAAVMRILNRHPKVFSVAGIDCEMTSTSVNGGHPVPAILQLANPDGYCAIFQLKVIEQTQKSIFVHYLSDSPKLFKYTMPSENILRQVLENSSLLKVGVGVVNDARNLEESYGLLCKGVLDIRHLASLAGIEPKGLDYLARKTLGKGKVEIAKKRKPWESKNLSYNQIEYAVQDARLGVEIFLKLSQILVERSYSWWRRLFWDERTYWKYTLKLCRPYIGVNFVFPRSKHQHKTIKDNWFAHISRPHWLQSFQRNGLNKYQTFIFESALPERLCYVCGYPDTGAEMNVLLKPMVPMDYNVAFEDDSLLYIYLCKDCMNDCRTNVDYKLRNELTEEFEAPYPDYEDPKLETAKKIATQLLSYGAKDLEKEWIKILEANLQMLLPILDDKDDLNIKTMETILSMDCWYDTEHGRFIHDYFTLYGGGLKELRWRWCERFWRVMRPRHLPWVWKEFYRTDPRWHWITT